MVIMWGKEAERQDLPRYFGIIRTGKQLSMRDEGKTLEKVPTIANLNDVTA